MNIKTWTVAVMTLTSVAWGATNDLTGLLQKGLFEEEADRNLDAAISNYQTLANAFDKDRQVAATAIFRLGECYRKLGRTNEAAAQYQRIVRDFSDQQTLVTLSQQNLAGMGATVQISSEVSENPVLARLKAEHDAEDLQDQINRFKGMNKAELRIEIAQNYPNPVLTKLMQQEADAQQQLIQMGSDYGPDHPKYQAAKSLLNTIDNQIDGQVNAVMKDLETRLNADFRKVQALQKQSSNSQLAANAQSGGEQAPITDEEEKEIRRIQQMNQNSPDLINSGIPGVNGGYTPLYYAAISGFTRVANFLLDHGADVNAVSPNNGTPLLAAVSTGNKAMVELLLNRGADINAKDPPYGKTALHMAAEQGFLSVAEVLLNHKADVNARDGSEQTPLHHAVENGRLEIIKVLLAQGADVNAQDQGGNTPLTYAVWHDEVGAAKLLIAAKADVDEKNKSGNTPLHEAAQVGTSDMVSLLIAAGANVDPTNFLNTTPLLFAVANSRVDAARVLLEHKADPNHKGMIPMWRPRSNMAQSTWNLQPIFFAIALKNDELMKLLLDARANSNERAGTTSTPLTSAIEWDYVNGVRLLLEHGANPNTTLDQSDLPLNEALWQHRDHEIVKLLLDHGANPNVTNRNGYVPLFQTSDTNITRWLVEHKVDVNARAAGGITALMYGQVPAEKLEILLSHGANPDLQDKNGNTALHHMVFNGWADCVAVLLEHKADPNIQNNLGYTPLDLAKSAISGVNPGLMQENMFTPSSPNVIPNARWVPVDGEKQIADMLTAAGGLADLPKRDRIEARRASNRGIPVFYKSSHDWNRYSLLEFIASKYGLLSTQPEGEWVTTRRDSAAALWRENPGYPFPDFEKVVIYRRSGNGAKQTAIPVDLEDILKAGDCSRDVWLEWGDVVEIPEADHPVDQRWEGLTESAVNALSKCVARQVTLKIKGESLNLKLAPQLLPPYGAGPVPDFRLTSASFMLRSVLDNSKLLRVSSDLTHVKVTRRDPVTKKTLEWTVDCTNRQGDDLWLRDGDVIEVPETM